MTRRPLIALAAVAAASLTGCATFTDADVAVRVGDDELTVEQLSAIIVPPETAADVAPDGRVPMTAIHEVLNQFVLDRVFRHDLAAAGAPLDAPGDPIENPPSATWQQTLDTWQTTVPERPSAEEVRALYELGPAESGLACVSHILVDDEATAQTVLDRLATGESFGALAAELSTDPGSADNGGGYPCQPTDEFASQFIPEYVDAALGAEVGMPVGPVATQFGYHVVIVRPFDELTEAELAPLSISNESAQAAFDGALARADIYVNPRYGAFDPAAGVVPLG